MILILSYMVIYNITSLLLFSTVLQASATRLQSLFSFASLGASSVYAKLVSLSILSLAGVPPLLGFFSKIFIFILITSANLFVLFPSFFILLFIGLYFYIQNIRFINASSPADLTLSSELSLRTNDSYYFIALPIAFISIFGFCYVEDLLLLATWLVY